jgi:hypothetical protein
MEKSWEKPDFMEHLSYKVKITCRSQLLGNFPANVLREMTYCHLALTKMFGRGLGYILKKR